MQVHVKSAHAHVTCRDHVSDQGSVGMLPREAKAADIAEEALIVHDRPRRPLWQRQLQRKGGKGGKKKKKRRVSSET